MALGLFRLPLDVNSVYGNSSGGRNDQPANHLQRCRFAGAVWAHQAEYLPGCDLKTELIGSNYRRAFAGRRVILFGQVVDLDHSRGFSPRREVLTPLTRLSTLRRAQSAVQVMYSCGKRASGQDARPERTTSARDLSCTLAVTRRPERRTGASRTRHLS